MGSLKDSGYIIIEFYWKTNYHTAEGGGDPSPPPIPSQKYWREGREGKSTFTTLHNITIWPHAPTHLYTHVPR